jgi:nitronate monooxygenase
MSNAFLRRLGVSMPLLQGPMAGEAARPALVAAVSNAGSMGAMGASYKSPQVIRDEIRAIRGLAAGRPFNINLFAPTQWTVETDKIAAYRKELGLAHEALGIDVPDLPNAYEESFEAQFAVILDEAPPVFSFTFGLIKPDQVAALKSRDIMVIGTATTVPEAKVLEGLGVDAIMAQGAEAGGHRGTFLKDLDYSLVGTMALVPQAVSAVKLPVIAAGGIGDGRGVAAALCLGASAVAMGTSFLLADEAGLNEAYKAALESETAYDTTLTRAFTGRYARGIRNGFVERMARREDIIPDFPITNAMTKAMRATAGKTGQADYLSLWAGQAARLARREPAAVILARVMAEAKQVLQATAKREI